MRSHEDFSPAARVVVIVYLAVCARVVRVSCRIALAVRGGGVFAFLEPSLFCLCRFSLALSTVREGKVQVSVMPPTPGLVMMRPVGSFDGVSAGVWILNT